MVSERLFIQPMLWGAGCICYGAGGPADGVCLAV